MVIVGELILSKVKIVPVRISNAMHPVTILPKSLPISELANFGKLAVALDIGLSVKR